MADTIRTFSDTFPVAEPVVLGELIEYGDDAIVSRTLAKGASGTLTLFAFDKGQELSEHTAPFDAFVQVVEGEVEIVVDGNPVTAKGGESVLMPAAIPHSLSAQTPMKMLLFMLRK